MRHILTAACLCLALPAFAGEDDHGHADDAHLAEAEGLRLLHPWAVPAKGGTEVYIEMQNTGDRTLVLTGGETHDGAPLVLMATALSGGGAEPIGEIPVDAGGDMDLEPGGLYLWLDGVVLTPGAHLDAHVMVEPLGEIEIEIEVFDAGTRQHPHAGHNH